MSELEYTEHVHRAPSLFLCQLPTVNDGENLACFCLGGWQLLCYNLNSPRRNGIIPT